MKILVFQCLLLLHCSLVCRMDTAAAAAMQEKEEAEAVTPMTTLSPPEGNTTFIDGTTWCVAQPGVPEYDLQNALDWACGLGQTDCSPIQSGGPCFEPETVASHASFAFNSYYQQNGNSDVACNFGGTATLTKSNPSYGKCVYAAPGSVGSSATPVAKYKLRHVWWKFVAIISLLLYWRS